MLLKRKQINGNFEVRRCKSKYGRSCGELCKYSSKECNIVRCILSCGYILYANSTINSNTSYPKYVYYAPFDLC